MASPIRSFPLSRASEGAKVRVTRISEYAENVGDLLGHLGERGLRPDAEIVVSEISPINQAFTLHKGDKYFSLSSQVADAVWEAFQDDRFLVLPHPEVQGYYEHRAAHTDHWLAGMRKLQRRLDTPAAAHGDG